MINPTESIAEVFANLATEVTDEIIFLEDIQALNPDVKRLSNINPLGSAYHIQQKIRESNNNSNHNQE
ncbi:hypothetical protein [Selenihalanaerobacter shriftii]|uniref:Uncharacterized protein n=1 Tax=Selenihalanaerobacter shriftii TaxID=142842 RepID=A0A1T4QSK6_9FIRM|nr:hypothetical protein [Selenihalanaerobacter shriftii]SKA06742.1 hypothetical protein SAMN02745118_02679 [Selenihalanaerobacter shriftii]